MEIINKSIESVSTQHFSDNSHKVFEDRKPFKFLNADLILDHYDFLEVIGSGGQGTVMKARRRSDNSIVAIKAVKRSLTAIREVQILSSVTHPFIGGMIEAFCNSELIFIILEYYEFKLSEVIRNCNQQEALMIVAQLLDALKYLHINHLIHRDIKPDNVMIQRKRNLFAVKIVDFGMAISDINPDRLQGAAGTNHYLAPEMISNQYSNKVDLWSLGIVLFEALFKDTPFRSNSQRNLFQEILKFDTDNIQYEQNTDIGVIELVKGLLQKNPESRLTAAEALTITINSVSLSEMARY